MIRSVYSALVWLVLLPVQVYRVALSPLKRGPSCRFLPTCSEYAITAVKQRGIIVGVALATWRILRCHPLAAGGYDPVPRRAARPDKGVPILASQRTGMDQSGSGPAHAGHQEGGMRHCQEH